MIEPGCLAIIVDSLAGNEGKIVRVGRFLGKIDGVLSERNWEVDQPLNSKVIFGKPNGLKQVNYVGEWQLCRIDEADEIIIMKGENLISKGQRKVTDEYRKNFDRIFRKGKDGKRRNGAKTNSDSA